MSTISSTQTTLALAFAGHIVLTGFVTTFCVLFITDATRTFIYDEREEDVCEIMIRNTRRLAALAACVIIMHNSELLTLDVTGDEVATLTVSESAMTVGISGIWMAGQLAAAGCTVYGVGLSFDHIRFDHYRMQHAVTSVQLTGVWLTLAYATLYAGYKMGERTQEVCAASKDLSKPPLVATRCKRNLASQGAVAYRLL